MKTELLSNSKDDIKRAASIIRSGGTVVFPTETVYGLGANALDGTAVSKIFKAKGRPGDNPLIVHIHNIAQADEVGADISDDAKKLMERFWPGPLTVIVKRKPCVPDQVTAGLDTVGIRMPSNETAAELLKEAGCPVAAPSANLSGKPSPTRFSHCVDDMNGRVDAIIDGGSCKVGVESTVIDMSGEPVIYRPGDITAAQIEEVLGKKVKVAAEAGADKPKSPGLKYKHYSPEAQVIVLHGTVDEAAERINGDNRKRGVILFDEMIEALKDKLNGEVKIISLGGMSSPKSAAANLFAALREMDGAGVQVIFAPEIPDTDSWAAVRNRLYRAAGKSSGGGKGFLFVCTGNTCRSPMAEGLFNHLCAKAGLEARASSAGLFVMPGSAVSKNSVRAMAEEGVDISGHVPNPLTKEDAERFDVILTMSESHKMSIIQGVPALADRVYTLGEYSGTNSDILDPYGGTYEQYKKCMASIKKCVELIIEKLKADD